MPREAARAMPKPVALSIMHVSNFEAGPCRHAGTYIKPRLIKAQTEIFVFKGSRTFQMTSMGSREQMMSVTMEYAAQDVSAAD